MATRAPTNAPSTIYPTPSDPPMSPAELASSGAVFGTSYLRTLAGKESVIGTDDAVGTAATFSMPVSVVFDEAPCATCNESSM